jgi:hypothetical protein
MNAIQAISGAARRAGSRKRMILIYWAYYTALAALVALPLMGAAVSLLSRSRYATELLRGFDVMWLAEAVAATQSLPIPMLAPLALLAILLAFKGSVFLGAGAVNLLVHDELDYSPREFYAGCGRYYWRFLRITLYSLLFYGIAMALSGVIMKVADKAWGEGLEDRPLIMAGYVKTAIQILLFGFIGTAMDYAKVRLVADGSRKSLRAVFGSIRLVSSNMGRAMGVWLLLALVLGIATFAYVEAANRIQAVAMGPILGLIVCQQLYVLVRVVLRMMAWGAAAELDPVLRPRQLPPEEPVLVSVAVEVEPPALETAAEAEPEQPKEPQA